MLVVVSYSVLFIAFLSPVIFKGSLLAVGGDGLYIYLPNFYARKVLWDTMLFSGFPMMADPQVMTWYPPAILLSLLPGTWNIFIVLAYVAASSFTYGYVYVLTNSRLAAAFSGVVFGLSGFMLAHLGHAVIIHAAAWIPLVIWSLETLRRRRSAMWFVAGSAAVALSCLGGHSQIFVYGLILSVSYLAVAGWNAPVGRWRYYSMALAMIVVGIALAAVQIIPAAELIGQSTRVSYSFQDFASHALPPRQAVTMIFPLVFGGVREASFLPYFGAVNQTELTGYVGLLPLLLAAVGIITTRRKSLSLFWLCAALVALLFAMGEATPLARIAYRVPVINQLRAPARHLITLTFAVSVLSGLGLAALQRREVSMRQLVKILVWAGFAMLVCLLLLFLNSNYLAALAARQGITQLSLLPWRNRAVGIPLLVFLIGIATLIFWYKQPRSLMRSALLLSILVIDLGSFGWFYEWRYAGQDKNALIPTADANRYQNLLHTSNQRLMPYRGPRGRLGEMPPNLTRLWGVPSASGYNVLILTRVSRLLPMIDYIDVPLPWQVPEDQSLNIVAARYFFLPRPDLTPEVDGISWLKTDLGIQLGYDCSQPRRDSVIFELPRPVKTTDLGLVSRLACSLHMPQGAEVVRYYLTDVNGVVRSGSLRAGLDSSEWSFDCRDIKPHVKHQRATVFKDYPAEMNADPCLGYSYITMIDLSRSEEIKSVKLEWVGPAGAMIVEKLTLIDKLSGTSHPIDSALITTDRWRFVVETAEARVYENLKAMPRAWLAREVVSATAEEVLNAIKTSRCPDGRAFDPAQTALVEEPIALETQAPDMQASATVVAVSDVYMEVHTSSRTPNFLVTSDVFYPGWRASIDGKEARLHRTDYVIRGLPVPAGQHVVRFKYQPRRFYLGAGISVLSVLTLGALAFTGVFRRKQI